MDTQPHVSNITIVRRALESAIRQLTRSATAIAWGRAGVNRTPALTELLCREFTVTPPVVPAQSDPMVALVVDSGDRFIHHSQFLQRWWREHSLRTAAPLAMLMLERAPQRGRLTCHLLGEEETTAAIQTVKLVGPGMHRLSMSTGDTLPSAIELPAHDTERWSRAIGALGNEQWHGLRTLHVGVIGTGRTGSVLATSLARLGVRNLTLIDPDRLELHNTDAMDCVTEHDIDKLKVTSVQRELQRITGDAATITALPDSITTLRAFVQAKAVDVLISCVDHDGARLATALIATLYLKPLIDIGAGIFGAGNQRELGADIRLILPDERCLLCFGGLANTARAREMLTGRAVSPAVPWHRERAGSLRSLNQLAAHFALRLLEDFVSDRLQQSTWLHLEFDPHGLPSLRTMTPAPQPTCPLCQRTGNGDQALDQIQDLTNTLLL